MNSLPSSAACAASSAIFLAKSALSWTGRAAIPPLPYASFPCRAIGPVGTPVWGKAHSFRCGFSLTEGRSFAGLGQSVWFFFIRRAFSKGEAGKNSWAAFWRKGLAPVKGRIKSLIRAEEKFNGYIVKYISDYYEEYGKYPTTAELKQMCIRDRYGSEPQYNFLNSYHRM